MRRESMLKPPLGLALLVLLAALACSNGGGSDVVEDPDTAGIDLGTPDVADVVADVAPPPPIPKVVVELEAPPERPCKCPAAGWCGMTNGSPLEITVFVSIENEPEGDHQGPQKATLEYVNAKGEKVVLDTDGSTSKKDGKEYFGLEVNPADVDTGDDGYPDGIHEMTIRVETDLTFQAGESVFPVSSVKKITVVIDTQAPAFTPEVLLQPQVGGVYAAELPVQYCTSDPMPGVKDPGTGAQADTVKFQLMKGGVPIDLPIPVGTNVACPATKPILLDVAQKNTDNYDLRLEVTDCVGNVGEHIVPDVTIVGLPNYDVPEAVCMGDDYADQIGLTLWSRAAHIGTLQDNQIVKPDLFPDLALFGEKGVAFALNDGAGSLGVPTVVMTDLIANAGYAMDVNGDLATDIVAVVSDGTASYLNVYLQHVKANENDYQWDPKGTFPSVPSQVIDLGPGYFNIMDRYDIDGDEFQDLLIAGPEDQHSMVMILHTGLVLEYEAGYVPPVAPKDDKGNELPFTEAPEEPAYFVLHDTVQGIGGISDAYVGQFIAGGPPEVAVVRPGLDMVTVVTIDELLHFGNGLDTLLCWGGATVIAKPADLRRGAMGADSDNSDIWDDVKHSDVEDLVLYSAGSSALHFLPNRGDGYFDAGGHLYNPDLFPGLCAVGIPDNPGEYADGHLYEQFGDFNGFGQALVPGTVWAELGLPPDSIKGGGKEVKVGSVVGHAVYVGEEPERIWLGDVAPSPLFEQQGIKDGVLDILVPMASRNLVAVFPGASYHGESDGKFGIGTMGNAGTNPRACAVADYDLDQVLDIVCIHTPPSAPGDQAAECFYQMGVGKPDQMAESFPIELPLPLSVDWQNGPVTATHMLVADVEADGDNDIIVATKPESINYSLPDAGGVWTAGDWQTEKMVEGTLPLVFTYRLESGIPDTALPDQSTSDIFFGYELSGIDTGDFNLDGHPDLAISARANAESACSGRTIDILLGNKGVDGINALDDLGIGKGDIEFYQKSPVPESKGRFLPMGGYLALQNVTGLLVAQLNTGDEIDDLIVFGSEYQSPGHPLYQPHQVGAFLVRFDSGWNECAEGFKKPYLTFAPPFEVGANGMEMCGYTPPEPPNPDDPPNPDEPGEPEYTCLPDFGFPVADDSHATYNLAPGQALPNAQTGQFEAGKEPIAGTIGDFFSVGPGDADGCPDFFVANADTWNATFGRGACSLNDYKYYSDPGQPPVHLFPIGESPVDIAAADLNQDGMVDAIAALGKDISVMYGKQGEFFDAPFYLAKGANYSDLAPTSLVVDDVNDDGWADLLVTSSAHDTVLVYLNGGVSAEEKLLPPPHRTRFLGPFTLPAGVNPVAMLVAPIYTDLQADPADNCNDVAVLNAGSGTVTLLRNRRCK
jgi:hypothetical protein